MRQVPSQSYGVSPATWDHTVLPATRHKWTRPTLAPASKLILDLPILEGWKAELTVITRQCTGQELISRSLDHKSDALTTTPPSREWESLMSRVIVSQLAFPTVICIVDQNCWADHHSASVSHHSRLTVPASRRSAGPDAGRTDCCLSTHTAGRCWYSAAATDSNHPDTKPR